MISGIIFFFILIVIIGAIFGGKDLGDTVRTGCATILIIVIVLVLIGCLIFK